MVGGLLQGCGENGLDVRSAWAHGAPAFLAGGRRVSESRPWDPLWPSMLRPELECARVRLVFSLFPRQGMAEPGAGVGPVAVGGPATDAEHLGRLGEGQAGEDSEFHQFSGA